MSDLTWQDDADVRLAELIASSVTQPVMVASFVVIAEVIDGEGERHVIGNTAEDQRAMTTLGLLAWAEIAQRERIAQQFREEHDDG